jgi:hypothetical protein
MAFGEAQARQGALSSLHSKVESGLSETNLNFIFGLAVLFGRRVVILATGGRV